MAFIDKLKNIRELHGFTQEELAEKLGVHRHTLINWEKGKTLPDTQSLENLAKIFDTDIDTLLSDNYSFTTSVSTNRAQYILGGILHNARKSKGYTYEGLGSKIGVSGTTIKNWESKDRVKVTHNELVLLCRLLDVSEEILTLGIVSETKSTEESNVKRIPFYDVEASAGQYVAESGPTQLPAGTIARAIFFFHFVDVPIKQVDDVIELPGSFH